MQASRSTACLKIITEASLICSALAEGEISSSADLRALSLRLAESRAGAALLVNPAEKAQALVALSIGFELIGAFAEAFAEAFELQASRLERLRAAASGALA